MGDDYDFRGFLPVPAESRNCETERAYVQAKYRVRFLKKLKKFKKLFLSVCARTVVGTVRYTTQHKFQQPTNSHGNFALNIRYHRSDLLLHAS